MSFKRRNTSSVESDDSDSELNDSPPAKRQKPFVEEDSTDDSDEFDHPVGREQPKSDPTYGQKGAFPGLEHENDELFYGPPSDGLEYLRMVRSEAKGVPNLLVASQPPQTHNSTKTEVNDGHTEDPDGGYYSDGAYTAAPAANLQGSSSASVAPKAQDLYYESLLMRFNLLRATMRCSPPLSAIKQLDSSHPISLPDSRKAKQNWRLSLQTTRPEMVQVACIDAESVLRIVKVLSGILGQVTRSRDTDRIRRVGAWVWAMLGKCKDRTELGSEEIAELRELGKEAGALLVNIQDHTKHPVRTIMIEDDEELTRELASVDGVGESTDVKVEENQQHGFLTDERLAGVDLDEAKKRLQGVLDMSEDATNGLTAATEGELLVRRTEIAELDLRVDEQVNTTLDMIITVVGDVYGQRDLLKFRRIWNEDVDV